MIKRIATVGGWTLVSRISGFIRDVVMAAVLGAGPMADAFFVAFRLPNHFRAIFAEGAFAAAFVPAYARVLQQAGIDPAKLFADRIAAALIAINLVLVAFALLFTPWVVSVLAPGLVDDGQFAVTVHDDRVPFRVDDVVDVDELGATLVPRLKGGLLRATRSAGWRGRSSGPITAQTPPRPRKRSSIGSTFITSGRATFAA